MRKWILLVASIPGATKTPRMRVWRALRAAGAAAVRDGVYLLPESQSSRASFELQASEISAAGGTALVLPLAAQSASVERLFEGLFDRREDYARLVGSLERFGREVNRRGEADARRRLAALRRELTALQSIDFFGGRSRSSAEAALARAEKAINAAFSTDEPRQARAAIERRRIAHYRGKRWATRRHLWIDRVASAWLIRRFIDPHARFLWLTDPAQCPPDAIGFDFDGATFTHLSGRVTFEVLAASFGLDRDPGVVRLAALVRYLDVGGAQVAEAAGVETIMAGIRANHAHDDAILTAMSGVLDDLYAAYSGRRLRRSGRRPRRS
jgi:hypothetical protein